MNIKAKAKAQFIIAGIALVFSIFALFTINKNNGLAWFSSNDKVTANGLAVQVKCDDIFVSIEYYTSFPLPTAPSTLPRRILMPMVIALPDRSAIAFPLLSGCILIPTLAVTVRF